MDQVEVVRGAAAPEELAAVVAVLSALEDRAAGEPTGSAPGGYAAWRRTRLAALAQTTWKSTR